MFNSKIVIFFITMYVSTIFFFGAFSFIFNPIRELEIIIESNNYDLVIAKQKMGYFELTFNSTQLGNIEWVVNRNLFNK